MKSIRSYLQTSRKIVSIFGILLCAIVVVGIWTINGTLTKGLIRSLSSIEFVINIAEKNTHRVEAMTKGLQEKLITIKQEIVNTGQEGAEIVVTPATLAKLTALNLEIRFETADEIVGQIHEFVESTNQLMETANSLPFLSIPSLPESHLETIQQRLSEMLSTARAIELMSLELEANGTGKAVSTLTAHMDKIHSLAQDIQLPAAAFNDSAVAAKQAATRIIEKLSTWILIGSIAFSLIFIWFIYAQLCLFVNARP